MQKPSRLENKAEISRLLDFYAALLSERQRSIMELYFNEDLSLAEIADELGISRQAVHDQQRNAEQALHHYEKQLALVARFAELSRKLDRLTAALPETNDESRALIDEIRDLL